LQIVLTTPGYDVDVGGDGLLSTTAPLVGSEVSAQCFEAAGAGPIELVPVARYSPEEPIPYGFYTTDAETEVGVISNDQYQALNPTTDAGSERSFADPGEPFGIYTILKRVAVADLGRIGGGRRGIQVCPRLSEPRFQSLVGHPLGCSRNLARQVDQRLGVAAIEHHGSIEHRPRQLGLAA
jgi:hypothetical protein